MAPSRMAEHGAGVAAIRGTDAERGPAETGHREQGEVAIRVERDDGGGQALAVVALDRGRRFTRDHVSVRDDESVADGEARPQLGNAAATPSTLTTDVATLAVVALSRPGPAGGGTVSGGWGAPHTHGNVSRPTSGRTAVATPS